MSLNIIFGSAAQTVMHYSVTFKVIAFEKVICYPILCLYCFIEFLSSIFNILKSSCSRFFIYLSLKQLVCFQHNKICILDNWLKMKAVVKTTHILGSEDMITWLNEYTQSLRQRTKGLNAILAFSALTLSICPCTD